jgi:thiol:disulfide interchange protein DsbG
MDSATPQAPRQSCLPEEVHCSAFARYLFKSKSFTHGSAFEATTDMKTKTWNIAVTATLLAAACAMPLAQAIAGTESAPMPKALSKALHDGLKLEKSFHAAGGMNGFIVSSSPGKNMVVYSPPDNSVLIAGKMVDENGNDLSERYLDQYGPKADYSQFQKRIETAPAVVENSRGAAAKSTIYVILDPNCIYCHLVWKALRPYQAAGLQIHWIPVAFQQPSSAGKAAALFESANAAALLQKGEMSYVEENESLGIDEVPVSAASRAKLNANATLMADMGFRGTPTILYKDKSGTFTAAQGMPRLSKLPEITGLPEQSITDAELQRFR